jgi:hypothetical protein
VRPAASLLRAISWSTREGSTPSRPESSSTGLFFTTSLFGWCHWVESALTVKKRLIWQT